MKTNFSFEVRYAAELDDAPNKPATGATPAQREAVMQGLQALMQAQFGALDPAATVQVSDSHKGATHKIMEMVTTLQDDQIANALKVFCDAHGVVITALE